MYKLHFKYLLKYLIIFTVYFPPDINIVGKLPTVIDTYQEDNCVVSISVLYQIMTWEENFWRKNDSSEHPRYEFSAWQGRYEI